MKKLDKLALKFQNKLSKVAQALPNEVTAPLMKIYKMLRVAQQEASRGKNREKISTNLVDSVDALKAYKYPLKSKDMLIKSLTKASYWASDPLTDKSRGAIAGTIGYWNTYLKRAYSAKGKNVLKYFTKHPAPASKTTKVRPAGKPTTSAQATDLTKVFYKSNLMGWKKGTDLRNPEVDLNSGAATKVYQILDAAKAKAVVSASITVDQNGNANVNAKVKGGNQAAVLTQMRRYFNPRMTNALKKAKMKPSGPTVVKWFSFIGYK